MTSALIAPVARFPCTTAMTPPSVLAGGLTLGTQPGYQTYMPYPDPGSDITWEGNEFGLTAPNGSNITHVAVTVTHRVSDTSAYDQILAQVYANGSPVGSPASFTPSVTAATGTVTVTSGIAPADLATLAVQVTFHSVSGGVAYVYSAYATASYSFADSVGIFAVLGSTSLPVPAITAAPLPAVALVALGTMTQNLSPSFGAPTRAGDLLVAWTFSNSSNSSFDTTCNDPTWTLGLSSGAAFDWQGFWYKLRCNYHETAPVFSSPGASTPQSQLAEFSGVKAFDQIGTVTSGGGTPNVTLQASSPDTASGDLIIAVGTWAGANPTPVVLTVTGTDSSGAALPLNTTTNGATTGQIPYAFSWGQASAPAGPGVDTISISSNTFDFGGGIVASFTTTPPPPAPLYWASMELM